MNVRLEVLSPYKVENGIAVRIPNRSRYPFDKMGIGDSFAFPSSPRNANRVSNAGRSYGKKHDMIFSVCKDTDGSHRCWRIA